MEDLLQVGVITTTHGVRGEVKVFPTTDDPARFKKLKNVILDTGKEKLELEIAGVKFFKNMVILKFKGIDDINDVEKYRKKSLYVTRENAVKPVSYTHLDVYKRQDRSGSISGTGLLYYVSVCCAGTKERRAVCGFPGTDCACRDAVSYTHLRIPDICAAQARSRSTVRTADVPWRWMRMR